MARTDLIPTFGKMVIMEVKICHNKMSREVEAVKTSHNKHLSDKYRSNVAFNTLSRINPFAQTVEVFYQDCQFAVVKQANPTS